MAVQRTVICLAVTTTLFGSFCCLLLGILIWRELNGVPPISPAAGKTIQGVDNATWIRTTFPGYFRTPREQEILGTAAESGSFEMEPVSNVSMRYQRCLYQQPCPVTAQPYITNTKPYIIYTTSTPLPPRPYPTAYPPARGSMAGDRSLRRRRQQVGATSSGNCSLDDDDDGKLQFHACCLSTSFFTTPDYLPSPDLRGTLLQIAQLRSMNLQQYFQIARCCQAAGCQVCQCHQAFYTTSAVVIDPPNSGKLQVKPVRVPGCCQCMNTGGS